MDDYILEPGPQLLESMRAVGYSLKTALADLVDNSLAADASKIQIHFNVEDASPHIAILDDGKGMTLAEAKQAMQLAGFLPNAPRSNQDLGRFGLGLKTASLSQCRRLTVISKTDTERVGVRWDLDHVQSTGKWSLQILNGTEIERLPRVNLLDEQKTGTLVIWQHLDALERQGEKLSEAADSRMAEVADHLALVFHQYIQGYERREPVTIGMNYKPLQAVDPFMRGDKLSDHLPAELIETPEGKISVQLFTLPVLGRMNAEQRKRAQIPGSMRDSQGFYIYRGGRLVIWGTWFRLAKRTELGKLARVKVDFPNSLDALWELDIKKSQAEPPDFIKARLKTLVSQMLAPSVKAHTYRGRKTKQSDTVVRLWDLYEEKSSFRYEINRQHPILLELEKHLDTNSLKDVSRLLFCLEKSFPIQDAVNRVARDSVPETLDSDQEFLIDSLLEIHGAFAGKDEPIEDFLSRILSVEPYSQISASESELIAILQNNEEPTGD